MPDPDALDRLARQGLISPNVMEKYTNARAQMGYRSSPQALPTATNAYDQMQYRRSLQSLRDDQSPLDDKQGIPFASNMMQAQQDMNLTPQEQNLYQHHLDNLSGSGKVTNPDGSVSTVYQAVVNGPDGKYYNIPTVWNGKILPPDQAARQASSQGWDKWPSYSSPEEADARYGKMHEYMSEDTQRYMESR